MIFVTDFNNYEQVYCDSNLGKDSISTKVMKTNFNNYKLQMTAPLEAKFTLGMIPTTQRLHDLH